MGIFPYKSHCCLGAGGDEGVVGQMWLCFCIVINAEQNLKYHHNQWACCESHFRQKGHRVLSRGYFGRENVSAFYLENTWSSTAGLLICISTGAVWLLTGKSRPEAC